MVGGIWEGLGFKAKSGLGWERATVATVDGAIEEVARVKLDSRLVGEDFQCSVCRGVAGDSAEVCGFFRIGLEYPVVVISSGGGNAIVVGLQSLTDELGSIEIHGGSFNIAELTGRDHSIVFGQELVAQDLNFVVADRGVHISTEVPVGVVDDINGGRLICACFSNP